MGLWYACSGIPGHLYIFETYVHKRILYQNPESGDWVPGIGNGIDKEICHWRKDDGGEGVGWSTGQGWDQTAGVSFYGDAPGFESGTDRLGGHAGISLNGMMERLANSMPNVTAMKIIWDLRTLVIDATIPPGHIVAIFFSQVIVRIDLDNGGDPIAGWSVGPEGIPMAVPIPLRQG